MANLFIDNITEVNQYDIDSSDDIFRSILSIRTCCLDPERFFLEYISPTELEKYNFNNPNSLQEFRNISYTSNSPLMGMAGCNLMPSVLARDMRYGGIKISDPYQCILGQFDVRDGVMTYSPIFPFFYEERDLIKCARDRYFTSLSFDEIVMNQIGYAKKFYVHIGTAVRSGKYILEEISRQQMVEYATKPELGDKVLKRNMKRQSIR